MKTVSICYITHNDLPMLRCTLPYGMRWADQLVVLDLGSTDGTKEFCDRFLRPGDIYHRRDTNTVPDLGYSEARNACASLATMDWVAHWGANFLLKWEDVPALLQLLDTTKADVLSTETIQITGTGNTPWVLEQAIEKSDKCRTEQHRLFVRNRSGIEFRGYIHEEAHRGDVNAYWEADVVPVRTYHFEGSGNHALRTMRNCWMFKRAVENPELQRYTNSWWYGTHYPKHQQYILAEAAKYEEYVAATGDK